MKPPMRVLVALLASIVAVPAAAAKPARPATMSSAAADSVRQALLADREDTEKWLKESGTSYLAAIKRQDYGDKKTLTVGSDDDNDVRVRDDEMSAHHLRVTVDGDSFHVEAVDAARFRIAADDLRQATVGPSRISVGRFSLRLSHQGFPAIIVFDPRSPLFSNYKGLKWYAVDFAYRYELPLTRNPRPDTVVIHSTRGNRRRAARVGWFDFQVGNKRCRLEATRLLEPGVGEDEFGIFFRDATSGKETYELGRYVEAQPVGDGRYVLDFNFAYNPACAVSDYYNCPIPPKENFLDVAIRAGEMDAGYHHP